MSDVETLVLIVAMLGAWFMFVGIAHALLWAAYRLHVPMPQWVIDHLHDEWGQR